MKHLPTILTHRQAPMLIRADNEQLGEAGTGANQPADNAQQGDGLSHLDPASLRIGIVGANGQITPLPGLSLPEGVTPANNAGAQQQALTRANNASFAGANAIDERLTNFATGYPMDPIQELADFLAPMVPGPLFGNYLEHSKANAYGVVDNDAAGMGGQPVEVNFDQAANQSYQLVYRGISMSMHRTIMAAYDAQPGWSAAQEWQERLGFALDWLRRGRVLRIISAINAATGAATAKNFNDSTDLLDGAGNLEATLDALAPFAGGRQNLAILFTPSPWRTIRYHKHLAGDGTNNRKVPPTPQEFAERMSLDPRNVMVTHLVMATAKQGQSTVTTSNLLTDGDVYILARTPNPTRRDPSAVKTFTMRQGGNAYNVVPYDVNGNPLMAGRIVDYWEYIKVVNSAAIKRWNVTDTAE